jgi:hypothetical protein
MWSAEVPYRQAVYYVRVDEVEGTVEWHVLYPFETKTVEVRTIPVQVAGDAIRLALAAVRTGDLG